MARKRNTAPAGSAPESLVPRTPSQPAGATLLTYGERQAARAAIVAELQDKTTKVSLSRATALAAALRGIDRIESAVLRNEEDERDRQKLVELKRIADNQTRMRSGVVTEGEAPQLPGEGD